MDHPFSPETKVLIIVREQVDIVREAVVEIAARCSCTTGQVKTCLQLMDYRQNLILQWVEMIIEKRRVIHGKVPGVSLATIAPGNPIHVCD